MTTESLIDLSSTAMYISFLLYLIAIVPLGLAVSSEKSYFLLSA